MSMIKKKSHVQSKYLTVMIVPDSTATKVRSLKIPHWFMYLLSAVVVCVTLIISGLSAINTYSRYKLKETAKIIEETNKEKKELLSQKEKIELQKQSIESNLSEQRGSFDRQLEFYMEQIINIEARLNEIEIQAQESYNKMNIPGSPVSKESTETFMGGRYNPQFDADTPMTERLNTLLATVSVECDSTEAFVEEYTKDVASFLEYKESIPSIWPVTGRVTSEYGSRSDPINGSDAHHSGIDIKADTGTRVKAAGAGTVTSAEYDSGYGNKVVINHGYGIETLYAHNSSLLVRKGQKVKKGDYIALSGNTGRSTGPHVHYEVKLNGVTINPRSYLQ